MSPAINAGFNEGVGFAFEWALESQRLKLSGRRSGGSRIGYRQYAIGLTIRNFYVPAKVYCNHAISLSAD